MFILIFIFVGSLLHGYLFWRVASLPMVSRHIRKKWLSGVAFLLWLLFLLGSVFGHDGSGGLASWLERIALDWFGVLFIASTVMLFTDLLTGFGFWARHYLSQLRSGAVLVAGGMIVVALVQGGRPPVVVRYEVTMADLPQALSGTTIAVLSDLHLGSQLGTDWMSARVKQVQALEPDMVLLLGDIFEGHGELSSELVEPLKRLQAPLGVYAVTGNHEFLGDTEAAIAMAEQAGVVWLRDRWLVIRPGLTLAGVDDLGIRWRQGKSIDVVKTMLSGRRHPAATILLSHTSWQAKEAAAGGVGLMLSGHNHGGQIWPFGYVVQHFFPLFAGRYEVDGMTVLVSRGTGLWGPRMRLWRPGEILEVTLTAP